MKVKIEKKKLIKVAKMAAEALPSEKTNLQITKCFVIKAEGQFLFIRSMSMEEGIGIQTGITCSKVEEPGEICVDGSMFLNLISKAPEGELNIQTNKGKLLVKQQKSKMQLAYQDTDQFPDDMTRPDDTVISIDRKKLYAGIEAVLFAVADDATQKKELGALHINLSNGVLRLEGLDGFRVASSSFAIPEANDITLDTLIPKNTAKKLMRLLSEKNSDKESDACKIYCNNNVMAVSTGYSLLTARLLEGSYFDVAKLTPQEYKTMLTVNKTELLDSLNRSLLYCLTGGDRDKPISFSVKEGNLTVAANSAIGEMKDELMAKTDGEDVVLHYNPRYMMETLKAIMDEDVTFYFNGNKTPCVIKGEDYEYMVLGVTVAAESEKVA
ncbi:MULTISPECIES: DNA polymerase III subunit beta [Clostridia]|uniref:DNA polymerase III subunit beta n=1 Tax=Clostridia TaxID=186801 RepID=UPI001314FD42|nr:MULTISPECIES: DNA polymerase III subunit beta [Clostridia]